MAATRLLYATGYGYNTFGRLATPAVPTDASVLYPIGGLGDGFPEIPFAFLTAGVNPAIAWDKNMVLNGAMALNAAGKVTLWTELDTGTGAVSYNGTGGPSGGPAASFTSGSGTASILQTILCRPGEQLTLRGSLKGDATHPITISVQNALDLTWLTPAGAWQTAPTVAMTQTAAAWNTPANIVFTVPTFAAQLWPLAGYIPLKVTISVGASAVACLATNVFLWPSSSLLGIFGYDSQPQLALAWNKGGTGDTVGAYTLVSNLTVSRPSFYAATAAGVLVGDRFMQLTLTGTPSTAPWFGEIVDTQYSTLNTPWAFGYTFSRYLDQVRTKGQFGATRTRGVAQIERRIWRGKQQDRSPSDFLDFLGSVQRLSGYGRWPIVIVPRDDQADILHGQLPAQVDPVQTFLNITDRELVLIEDPFPTFIA